MDFIQNMAREQARAAALDADGSLSDPDEEEPFVLTDPATLAQGRFQSGPARQRQRLSYNSLEQHTLLHSWTSNSLTQAHASNTSLLGIDFVRNDSAMSLSKQALTGSGSRAVPDRMCAAGEDTGLGQGERTSSHESLQSIGLALEASTDSTRDLVTPPPLPHDAMSRTLSAPKLARRHETIRISGSNDQTICMMACQARNKNEKMSPDTMYHGNMSPGTMCLG